jgi:formylglycine-generating enzyme required for sulfatase activity
MDAYEAAIDDETGAAVSEAGRLPATEVTHEEAAAACRLAGKALCPRDVWELACRGDGDFEYPYGDTYDGSRCNTYEAGETLRSAGAFPGCEGGYPGLFDLSGNAFEWTSSCVAVARSVTECDVLGGYYGTFANNASCSTDVSDRPDRTTTGAGFRCCARGSRP